MATPYKPKPCIKTWKLRKIHTSDVPGGGLTSGFAQLFSICDQIWTETVNLNRIGERPLIRHCRPIPTAQLRGYWKPRTANQKQGIRLGDSAFTWTCGTRKITRAKDKGREREVAPGQTLLSCFSLKDPGILTPGGKQTTITKARTNKSLPQMA